MDFHIKAIFWFLIILLVGAYIYKMFEPQYYNGVCVYNESNNGGYKVLDHSWGKYAILGYVCHADGTCGSTTFEVADKDGFEQYAGTLKFVPANCPEIQVNIYTLSDIKDYFARK